MHYGMQLSASGALTAMYRMDVLANNLANMSTAGFKADIATVRQRDAANIEDGLMLPSNAMLERLGGGVHLSPNRIRMEQGVLTESSSELDLAIQGRGFFVVRGAAASEGGDDAQNLRLTRNGRFAADARGRLVTADDGSPVVSASGGTITLKPGVPVTIAGDGTVTQKGAVVGKIRIADVDEPEKLRRAGQSCFALPEGGTGSLRAAEGIVRQKATEQSMVDPTKVMLELTAASREVESNVAMIQYSDRMLERAIGTLGRTA